MALFTSRTTSKPAVPVAAVDLTISDVAERVRQATPQDTCKGMFFNGVLSATRHLGGEEALEVVRATLPEKKYVDFFNYPIVTFLPAAFKAARLLQVGSDFDGAMRRLGEQAIDDFLSTPVGRTLVTVSSGEAKRLMRAAPTAYKTAVSYGTRETVMLSDTSCVFKVRRDFMPHPYHEGVLFAVLRALGTKDTVVRGERLGLLDADYHLSWK
ncbi:MAG: TIGR02265 family protein [Myxococcota bacterium]